MHTFLIADDSDGKVMMLTILVKKSGIAEKIVRARTTEEAKKLIDTEKPAFAFVDYEMPTEEGPAVIRYLKQKNSAARIALVSSSNAEEYVSNAKDAGAETCLCTSYEEDRVVADITDVLARWKGDK